MKSPMIKADDEMELDISLIETSFEKLAPNANELAKLFYKELFEKYPSVKPLFKNTRIKNQEKKLVSALSTVVSSLRKPDELEAVLIGLGNKHIKYGAKPEHYEAVIETLLEVMANTAGNEWSEKIENTWRQALNSVASTMIGNNRQTESSIMASASKSVKSGIKEVKDDSALRMQAAVDNAMTPFMMVDLDLVITYTNEATIALLNKHSDALKSLYTGFSVDNIVGTCIDIFHKDPSHQRKLLSDPSNLPYSTDIQVGPLSFALNVTAQIDSAGNYIGTTLEWSDVTELRVKESAVARLQGTVNGAMTAMMMVDRDFFITYANQSTLDLLKKHEAALATVYAGFKVDNLIGTCIDDFHKNPQHQREFLANPANLPYQTDIAIGDLTFALNVTAIMDANGDYVGNALEWSDVSDLRQKEALNADYTSQIEAIGKSQAVIEFNMDGTIIQANDNFLNTVGYSLEEIQGKHHHLFVEPEYAQSVEYTQFWERLNTGVYESARYKRLGKGGKEIWIQASYNPIMGLDGKPFKVVKYATDVTETMMREADLSGQADAISKSQAVIEFNMDGTIIQANDNFLNTVGYSLEEIQGKHHRMFVESDYGQSQEYLQFWNKLNAGEFESARYKRLGKGGKEVWIQASYNPIFDLNGKPYKVIKYATDVTLAVEKELAVARLQSAIDGAQTNMMLCDTDLTITYANPAVVEMLVKRETELRSVFPGFDPHNLIGQCIDQFHKNPSHQRSLLGNKNNLPAKAEIRVAGLEFEVNATAVMDGDGNLLGNMVEWRDITEQKDAERQMEGLIQSASAGDLSKRIDSSSYEGFMKNLSDGINQMLEAVVAPVQEGTRVMKSLAEGDLSQNMVGEFQGEFGVLQQAIDTSVNNLRNMVGDIRESASAITSGAGEIAQGNQDLSQRTEEQASSLEETASSMEQLTGTVKQNADNANQANQLASGAREQAEKGGKVVGNAVSAMSEINSSSKKIADIISVIDEIAFQTNLLALNAAVEAARAGEQGRGFAVVAGEVRNLAQRSAAAAKEIKALINDSVEKVDEGSKLVDESGKTLDEIVTAVKKVSDIIAEIAAASQEQSTGIDQVNKAIIQMDEVTQQNAALVEEAAAASESMDEQSKGLSKLMEFFGSDDSDEAPALSRSNDRSSHSAPVARSGSPERKRPSPRSNQKSSSVDSDEWEEF